MYRTLLSGCVWSTAVLLAVVNVSYTQRDFGVINIYETQRLAVHEEGDTGILEFKGPVTSSTSPSVLRLQASPSCYVQIKPEKPFHIDIHIDDCTMDKITATKHCIPGCFYAYVFDGYYYNETLVYFRQSDEIINYYNTSSSVLYIAVCHSGSDVSFFPFEGMELRFETKARRYTLEGNAFDHSHTGTIMSPYFPKNYIQNGEQTTYIFQSDRSSDKVVLEFDDFDIAPGGALYFDNAEDFSHPVIITDDSFRMVVVSKSNMLKFIFDNGWPGAGYRNYLGFKVTYRFISEFHNYVKPFTYCGKYYMTLHGGHIKFQPTRYDVPYDCVWVVKTQPGYKGMYMKLDRFSQDHYGNGMDTGDVRVEIHSGLTSNGTIVGTLFPTATGMFRDYDDPQGFYIRLHGKFRNQVTFKMAFTSYNDFYTSGCDSQTHFRCSSGQCIPNQLQCDSGTEHCKDGSDETLGCTGPYDSNQQTLTVSVIIPMVVSIFLLIVLCILFVLVRRCRQARQFTSMTSTNSPVVCTSDRHRRRRRRDGPQRPPDAPPTYDEALINSHPIIDDNDGQPKPPTYIEAVNSPLVEESSYPAPPYYSREDLHQSFLDDGNDPANERTEEDDFETDAVSTSNQTNQQSVNAQQNHRKTYSSDRPYHLPDSGRLPPIQQNRSDQSADIPSDLLNPLRNFQSIQANVGTQSLYDISNIGQNNLVKARSEQVLSARHLEIRGLSEQVPTLEDLGMVNKAYVDDQGQQSRLYRGQAVSSLELPTSVNKCNDISELEQNNADRSSHHQQQVKGRRNHPEGRGHLRSDNIPPAVRSMSREHQNNRTAPTSQHQHVVGHGSSEQPAHDGTSKRMSAKDRLKPKNPNLVTKYNKELARRENKQSPTSTTLTDRGPKIHSPQSDFKSTGLVELQNGNVGHDVTKGRVPQSNRGQSTNRDVKIRTESGLKNSAKYTTTVCDRYDESNTKNRLDKMNLRGSNLSLDLCAGHRSEISRSSMSLNENMLSSSGRSFALKDGSNGAQKLNASLDELNEDIYV